MIRFLGAPICVANVAHDHRPHGKLALAAAGAFRRIRSLVLMAMALRPVS